MSKVNIQQEKMLLILLVILSLLTSFALIYYGLGVIMGGTASQWLSTFAYVTLAYALGNVAVLSLAWTTREVWAVNVIRLMALCYLGVFVMDVVKMGIQEIGEVIGIIAIGSLLWANCVAVKKVVERN